MHTISRPNKVQVCATSFGSHLSTRSFSNGGGVQEMGCGLGRLECPLPMLPLEFDWEFPAGETPGWPDLWPWPWLWPGFGGGRGGTWDSGLKFVASAPLVIRDFTVAAELTWYGAIGVGEFRIMEGLGLGGGRDGGRCGKLLGKFG